ALRIGAVHCVIDGVRADRLREKRMRAARGVALDFIDCPDRRLAKAASDLAERETQDPGTYVTAVLPRRGYSALLGRLLHDRTADKMAEAISRVPRSAATIVPCDVRRGRAVLPAGGTGTKAVQAAKPVTATDPVAAEAAVTLDADGEQTLALEADVANAHEFPADGKRGHATASGPRGGRARA